MVMGFTFPVNALCLKAHSFWPTVLLHASHNVFVRSIFHAAAVNGPYTQYYTGTVYFRIVALSYIPMAVSNILSSWLRCKEYATIPFLASFGAVIVNTGLNYLLIFGKFGFPCMAIKGAAIATLISQLFNLVFIVIGFVLCIKKDGDKPVLSLHFKKITIRDYLIMIMPILISKFLWSLGQNVESAVYGHLGTSNLAAYTLTSPIQGLIVGALSGLSAAAGVMIGKRLGRKEYHEAYAESKKIMYAGLFGGVAVSALLILLAGAYTGLYRVDDSVKELGKTLLIVFALYAPVKVENMILGGGIIRSGGNTKTIMIIDISKTEKVESTRRRYGEFQNVFLSDEECSQLETAYPGKAAEYIERLSRYMASNDRHYANHYATIKKWLDEDSKGMSAKNYTYDDNEGECL